MSTDEAIRRRRESVQFFEDIVAREGHNSIWIEQLEDARNRLRRALDDYRGAIDDCRRHVGDATHIIVGDHDPEPRQ
jgi:hypothetical protein